MALKKWAYLYLSPGFSPEKNTTISSSNQCEFIAVGFDFASKQDVIEIVRRLIADGVQMIELCGGFGPLWVAKVSEAINGIVPVGSTAYGPEARKPMLDILAE
ncbi:MAG: hypothetical protein C5B47_05260 [Verrucomicrobia bacterium]|nr:MAG: hypothetical protein C5B47_05260 [Verrucomicrobiota bacterium]